LAKPAAVVSISSAALEALESSTVGVVHSVFERTFNILIGGALVGVVRSDISLHPVDMRTDVPPGETMPSLGVKKGMPVWVLENKLLVGDALEINLADAKIWKPPTQVEKPLAPNEISRNLELARQTAVSRTRAEGLGQLLNHLDAIGRGEMPAVRELNDAARKALPNIVGLVKAVRNGDTAAVENTAKNLVGLGPGLTPSADDMLVGFTGALWWTSRSLGKDTDMVSKINCVIVSHADRTNLLSRQLLQHAARGNVNERLGELFTAILAGPASKIEPLVARIMKIGESSGIDMMVGLLLGVQVGLEVGCAAPSVSLELSR
jgi:hypothetical protein